MKTFLILCVVLVARIHAEFVSPFPMEYDQVLDACRIETNYTDEVVANEEESYFSENRGLRVFNYCFLDKTGFVNRDGKLNVDDALATHNPSLLKDIVEYCNNQTESVFVKCFHGAVSTYKRFKSLQEKNTYNFELNPVTRAFAKNLTQFVDACREETGYTDEVIAEEEKSNLNNDAGLKKFNNCFLGKTGFKTDEGFDMDNVLTYMPQSNVTETLEHCQSLTNQKIIPDSVPYFSACLHLGVSDYFRSVELRATIAFDEIREDKIVDACKTETGFYIEFFAPKIPYYDLSGIGTDQEGLRKFNDCYLEKTGIITSDGKLNIDLANIELNFPKSIVEHCQANIILKYIKESVQDFSNCYHDGVHSEIESKFANVAYWKIGVPGTSFANNDFITVEFDDDFVQLLSKWSGFN